MMLWQAITRSKRGVLHVIPNWRSQEGKNYLRWKNTTPQLNPIIIFDVVFLLAINWQSNYCSRFQLQKAWRLTVPFN